MFYRHLIVSNEKEEVLYLYMDYSYEFSEEFDKKTPKEKTHDIYHRVIDYIKHKQIKFDGTKIFLVVNGIIISSLMLSNYPYQELADEVTPKYQYVEYIKNFSVPNINTNANTKESNISTTSVPDKKEIITTARPVTTPAINKQSTTTTQPKANNDVVTNQASSINTSTSTTTSTPPSVITPVPVPAPPTPLPTPTPTITPSPTNTVISNERTVTLYRSTGVVETINLEDYITGVVSAEMPASFQSEALKAQAVAARTYALKKIDANQVLKDTDINQVYKDTGQLRAYWGNSYDTYYSKVKQAVYDTKGEYVTYNGKYIDAVYHSTNNGKTESSIDVWGNYYPYLVSVDSHWDIDASSYYRETTKDLSLVNGILGFDFSQANMQILTRTDNNSVATMQIGDNTYTGIQLRDLFGLRSTDFDIRVEANNVIFTTKGYGHGVGMSQYGANGMAKDGYNYHDILTHYYTGVNIKKLV